MNTKPFGDVPEWIVEEVKKARKRLGIHPAWYISITMSEEPHGFKNKDGACHSEVPYLMSGIEFKPSIEEDEGGRDLVWHEVAHIVTAPLLEAAYKGLDQIKNKQARKLAKRIIDDAEEQLINQLTYGLLGS